VVLLCILICTILGAAYLHTHERILSDEFIGYSGEARYNDFLAAELLLKAADIDSDSRPSLKPSQWLPDSSDTIVSQLTAAIGVKSEQLALLEWVSSGGHLVVLPPPQDSHGTDAFLSEIGVALVRIEVEEDADAAETSPQDAEVDYVLNLNTTRHRIDLLAADDYHATLSDDSGAVVARREWGGGYITVIADAAYFLNWSLDDFDHARLLLDIVAGYLEPGKVWFVLHADFESLWQLLRSSAPFAVLALVLTVMLWLWSIMPGFGPGIDAKPPERRSILEHIVAAGQFAWRHHGSAALSSSSVAALIRQAESRHPGLSRLSADRQSIQLARLSGEPAQVILDALLARDETRHREFTHNAQTLQRIRTKL
jgi:hypothetical protein